MSALRAALGVLMLAVVVALWAPLLWAILSDILAPARKGRGFPDTH